MEDFYPFRDLLCQKNIIGVGATAFSRLGLSSFLPNYEVLCLKKSDEDKEIKKDFSFFQVSYNFEERKHFSTILNILDSPEGENFLKKIKDPVLYLYFANRSVERFLKKKKIKFIGTATSKFFNLRSKVGFYKLLARLGVKILPHLYLKKSELDFKKLHSKLGGFVLQRETRGGGKGTIFVFSKDDFKKGLYKFQKLSEEKILRATKYISGTSPSMIMCITSSGVIYSPLQYQIISPKNYVSPKLGQGQFAGHDWSSSEFSLEVQRQAREVAQKLGNYLKGKYRGILGIDFVLDEKKEELYPIECNPRLLGSFPAFPMIQERQNEPQILYFHFLANLFPDLKIDVEKINQQISKKKKGAQIILNNRQEAELEVKRSLKTGVYNFKENQLNYLRPGYSIVDLKNEEEFIITDGLLSAGTIINKYRKICRVLTLAKILDNDKINLNSWICRILDKIYQRVEEGE